MVLMLSSRNRRSYLVKYFLGKLRTKYSYFYVLVNSSFEVVNQLNELHINPYDMQLFDFSSLYTSIDNNTVIDSFMFLQQHLNIDACTIKFMLD